MPQITDYGFVHNRLPVQSGNRTEILVNQFSDTRSLIPQSSIPNDQINEIYFDKIRSGTMSSQTMTLDVRGGEGDAYLGIGTFSASAWTCTGGILIGIDDSDSDSIKAFFGDASSSMDWNVTTANTLTVVGAITASSGAIGGFDIGADYIRDVANSFGLASTVTAGDDVRFWAGDTFANRATADFRVTEAGAVTATSITLSTNVILSGLQAGSSLDGQYLAAASVASDAVNLALRGWTQTSAFSVTDADTVSWGVGTFTASDGTAYSIGAGGTGNMAARTYIYLDIAVSTIAYQTTTTAATAVGNGKVLIATALNGTNEATFQVFSGVGGLNISGLDIALLSITAGEIANTTITAGKIVSGTITTTQIAANTIVAGNIAAGTITTTEIAANTIVAGNIAAGTITTTEIAALTIIGGNIAATTITAGKLSVSQLSAITADMGTITAGSITAGTATIGAFAIGSATIAATNLTLTSGASNTANISVGTGSDLAGMNSGNASSDIAFWAGNTHANRATAPFRVDLAGNVTATNVTNANVNQRLNSVTSDVVVGNSVTETTLVSFTLNGGFLSTNNMIKVILFCEDIVFVQANETRTFRLKYGATTLSTLVIDNTSFGALTVDDGIIEAWMYGNGATNSQEGCLSVDFPDQDGNYDASLNGFHYYAPPGTAAEDSTGNLTFTITYQAGNPAAGSSFTMRSAITHIVRG